MWICHAILQNQLLWSDICMLLNHNVKPTFNDCKWQSAEEKIIIYTLFFSEKFGGFKKKY